jgi:hypothetical protein
VAVVPVAAVVSIMSVAAIVMCVSPVCWSVARGPYRLTGTPSVTLGTG